MSNQNFTIRQATIDDLDKLTELHMACFTPEQHLPVLLGKRFVKATYQWHLTSGHCYIVVAEEGNTILGLIGACDFSYERPMLKACIINFIISLLLNPALIFNKQLWRRFLVRRYSNPFGTILSEYPVISQITFVATASQSRGKGISGELVKKIKVLSKSRGSRAIRVGVYKYNEPSKKVFIKRGWNEVPELETQDTVFFMKYLDPTLPSELITKFKQLYE
jgi:ribosomal protein S18 acetylase RimI-like enzyme